MSINYDYAQSSFTDENLSEEEKKRRAALLAEQTGAEIPPTPVAPTENPADTEIKTQTIKTYGDGSQEHIVKTQLPAPIAPEPEVLAPKTVQQEQPIQQPVQPQNIEITPAAQQQMEQARLAQTQQPIAPAVPNIGQVPEPGMGVQVAGPSQLPPQASTGQGLQMNQPVVQQAIQANAPKTTLETSPEISFTSNLIGAQSDPVKLAQLAHDTNLTPAQRTMASRMYASELKTNLDKKDAEDEVKNMNQSQIAKMLTSKNAEGSWGKALLFGILGMGAASKDEQVKLGIGARWDETTINGKPALVKLRADGLPMEGYNSDTGAKLSAKELATAAGGIMGKHVSTTAETYIDPATGDRYRSQTDEKGKARLVNIQSGASFTGDMKTLQRQTDVSSMARVDYGLATDLLKKHSGNVLDMMKEYETVKGPMTPEARTEFMQRYGYGNTVPGAKVQTPTETSTTLPDEKAKAIQRAQGDVAGTDRQIAELSRLPAADPTKQQRIAILQQEKAAAQQRVQELGGSIAGAKSELSINEARIKEEQKPVAEAKGKAGAKIVQQQAFADNAYPIVKEIGNMIKQSTGSGLGASMDELVRVVGISTKGGQAIKQLEVFAGPLVSMVPRFEGAQSDADVREYRRQAGDFANPKLPDRDRIAALQGMVKLLKIYDKEGNNDWTFGEGNKSEIKIISREKVR